MPVDIGIPGARVHWRQDIYRGKVVHFCISIQSWDEESDEWCDVYRVDTAHGELHDHVISRRGAERRRTIDTIPDLGWDFVDAAWDEWLDRCLDECQNRIERWNRDE